MNQPRYIVSMVHHGCIRAQKEALALPRSGYNQHLITGSLPSPSTKDFWKTIIVYPNTNQLQEAIKLHKDADLFHCHNEPNWHVQMVKSFHSDMPIVFDVHDSMVLRYPDGDPRQYSASEKNAMQMADGLVFVSEPMRQKIVNFYGLDTPSVTLESFVPNMFYRYDARDYRGGVVYEGGVMLKEHANEVAFEYCDYRDLAKKLFDRGIQFTIYPPETNLEQLKQAFGKTAIIEPPVVFDKLCRKLNSFDWGLVGNIYEHAAWQLAMPNKLFEYIAAGLPIVAFNAPTAGEFIEREGFGIQVSSVDELFERWSECKNIRKTIVKKGQAYTMENNIHKLECLYDQLL